MGSVESVVSASICSVTRMVPSSAAMAAPTRPATIRPASTGPSSRVSETTTMVGMALSAWKREKPVIALQRQHHAGEDGGQAHDRQGVVADVEHLADDLARVVGADHAGGDGTAREQSELADGLAQGQHGMADEPQGIHAFGCPRRPPG